MITRNAMEVALAVDSTIIEIQNKYETDEQRSSAILLYLSVLCYDWSTADTINVVSSDTILESVVVSIAEKIHEYWLNISEYCKSRWEIELHPLGVFFTLRMIMSNSDEPNAKSMIYGIDQYISKIEKEVRDELDISTMDISSIDISDAELITEYMRLMDEIGTFYKDRNMYTTEKDKELHDRIVSIYHKISEL